jgi:hypothetical protein
MSEQPHTVQRCRWAEPTLFQKNPLWTAADQYPWTCLSSGEPRPVEDTAVCTTCGKWASRSPALVKDAPAVAERCHCGCGDGCKGV